jgi:hypothetical protein
MTIGLVSLSSCLLLALVVLGRWLAARAPSDLRQERRLGDVEGAARTPASRLQHSAPLKQALHLERRGKHRRRQLEKLAQVPRVARRLGRKRATKRGFVDDEHFHQDRAQAGVRRRPHA